MEQSTFYFNDVLNAMSFESNCLLINVNTLFSTYQPDSKVSIYIFPPT